MEKALVVLSGGQDSTTCLYLAKRAGYEVHCLTIDYGQRHRREIEAARVIAARADCSSRHDIVEVGRVLHGTSPLVSDSGLEQYANHASLPGGLEKTFVPMRNQLLLTLAANRAYCIGASVLYTGVCQEDFGGYPDCRRIFIDALQMACNLGTFTGEPGTQPNLSIETPLMYMAKRQTVLLSLKLKGCYDALAYSHTSYDGQYPPTGHDHATLLRAKGFEEANVPDPLVLRAYIEGAMPLPDTKNYNKAAIYGVSNTDIGLTAHKKVNG